MATHVHADHADPIDENHVLIVIDAYSKCMEAFIFPKAPTSATPIEEFQEIFTNYGLPYTLVTNNASYFTSIEFQEFLASWGITHGTSPPNNPATNSIVEKTVQTLKSKIKKAVIRKPISSTS